MYICTYLNTLWLFKEKLPNVLLKKEPKAPFSSYGYLVYFVEIHIKVSKNYGTPQIFGSKKTLRRFAPCHALQALLLSVVGSANSD